MNYKDLSRLRELSGIKEADRIDVTHAQLLPHIKNVKAAMVRHAQEDPSEAREFIEHLDDMMDAGDVEVVDMMQPDYMDTEARDSLIFYFQVSISQDPALYNMLFPGEDIKFAQGEYADMFESLTPVKENLVDDMPHGLLDGMTFTDGSPDYDYMGNAMNDGEVDWPEINDWHKDENGNVKPEATIKPEDFEISDLEADSEEYYESEVRRLRELSGITEAPYQYDMSDKGDMHDALAGVQNSMDDAVKSIQKASGLARQVSDEIENSLYTDESVEEEAVLKI